MRSLALSLALALILPLGTAQAHIELLAPAPRSASLKSGPCGAGAGDVRGDKVTVFAPGATITVRWRETVPHPGYYRISFDPDGQDLFVDPPGVGEPAPDAGVLVDNIPDQDGSGTYEQEVTLPDIACDNCTLQVVQVMTDKAPYGDGNDLYYQCADLVLGVDGDEPPATSGDPPDDGCNGCRSGQAVPWAWLALALLLRPRRRLRSGS